jgi:hypothetical protein
MVHVGIRSFSALVIGCILIGLAPAPAWTADLCLDQSDAEGRPIRAFTVSSRWNSLGDVKFPVPLGTNYTSEAASAAMNAVRMRLNDEADNETQTRGFVGVRYIEACPRMLQDGLEVAIKVIEIRLPFDNPIKGLLPGTRSNLPSSVVGTPTMLTLFNPEFGLTNDTAIGLAQTAAIRTDLLSVGDVLKRRPNDQPSWTLPLSASGRRGLNEDTYDGFVNLAVGRDAPLETLQRFDVHGNYEASKAPQGDALLERELFRAGALIRVKPATSPLRQLTFLPNVAWSDNRRQAATVNETTHETAVSVVAVADAAIPLGPLRSASLVETSNVENGVSYQRFSTIVGWNVQVPLSRAFSNRTLGIELSASTGHVWGTAPEHSLFYAGNTGMDLFMSPSDSPALPLLLTIPNLRSFGQSRAQTALGGARSYWGLNFNAAIPIASWLLPLIPRDEVATGTPLNVLVYNQGTTSARSFLTSYYEQVEHRNPEEAERLANAEIARIEPALRFITRRANLYALKPLFMFDAVRLSPGEGAPSRTFKGIGGGLQLTVVVARVEAGYLWTLDREPEDPSGNFVFRLIFDNIF